MNTTKAYALILALGVGAVHADGAVQLLRAFVAKSVPTDSCTPTPTPATSFSRTDPAVWLWFEISQGAKGDVASSQWLDPNGRVLTEPGGPWQPLEKAGDYCFSEKLTVAGNGAAIPGNWTVRIFWNNAPLATVSFTIQASPSAGPSISRGGVVNGADYTPALAPGMMVSIFGQNLAPRTSIAQSIPLPQELEGVSVEVAEPGNPAVRVPLYFVSSGQINFQLPFNLQASSVSIRVRTSAGTSEAVTVALVPSAPRLFTRTLDGKGEPIMVHANWSFVSRESPAMPGETVILLATGLGAVDPPGQAGRPGGDNGALGPINHLKSPAMVWFGSVPARPDFVGLMPGFAGVYQINVRVPEGVSAGLQEITVGVGDQYSQANVRAHCGTPLPLLAATTLGSAGGTVRGGAFSLSVPAGALSSPTEIRLYRKDSLRIPIDGLLSEVVVISGLPAELPQPIEVSAELSRAPAAGATVLAAIDTGPAARGTGITYLPATVSGTKVTVVLPASVDAPVAGKSYRERSLRGAEAGGDPRYIFDTPPASMDRGLTFLASLPSYTTQHFRLTADADPVSSRYFAEIGAALEEAYSKLEKLGIEWTKYRKKPIIVHVAGGMDPLRWAEAENSLWGDEYGSIRVNREKLRGGWSDTMKTTLGHELFHIAQAFYDPRGSYRKAKFRGLWYWYEEAASTWFEGKMLDNPDYLAPLSEEYHSFLVEHGLEVQSDSLEFVQTHGYGAASFLRYLLKSEPEALIVNVLKLQRETDPQAWLSSPRYNATQAIARSVQKKDISNHWLDFAEAYMSRRSYPKDFPTIQQLSGLVVISKLLFKSSSDSLKSIAWDMPDLSAKVFRVETQTAWPANTRLTIRVTHPQGAARVILYKLDPSDNWTKLATFAQSYEIPNAETLYQKREVLYGMVVNTSAALNFMGVTNVRVEVGIGSNLLPLLQSSPRMEANVRGPFEYRDSSGRVTASGKDFGSTDIEGFMFGNLKWSGTRFEATGSARSSTKVGYVVDYQISGEVDASGTEITSMNLRLRTYSNEYSPVTQTDDTKVCQFTKLKQSGTPSSGVAYSAKGPSAVSQVKCEMTTKFIDNRNRITTEWKGTVKFESASDGVEVTFWYWK